MEQNSKEFDINYAPNIQNTLQADLQLRTAELITTFNMGSSQKFSLSWNNYLSHITGSFRCLRNGEDLVDVTLSCEGKTIRAHKILLSACSPYFRDVFKENPCQHPVIIFRNVKYEDLVAIIDFMYQGEVSVAQGQISSFLATAELLTIEGLSNVVNKDAKASICSSGPLDIQEPEPVMTKPNQTCFSNIKKPFSPKRRKRKQSVSPAESSNSVEKKQIIIGSCSSSQANNNDEKPNEESNMIPKIENEEIDITSENDSNRAQSTDPVQTEITCELIISPSASEYSCIENSNIFQDATSDRVIDTEEVVMEHETSRDILPQDSVQVQNIQDISELSENCEETQGQATNSSDEITKEEEAEKDNYACDICRQEKKIIGDVSYKCPICSEEMFCSHLLKEHMKIIHGWFTVQRRFQSHCLQ